MNAWEFRHFVGLGETSMVGNVYFARYLDWQGRCREKFLHDQAPGVIELLQSRELAFATRSCSCDYCGADGFYAGDEVLMQMRLSRFRGGRMSLAFEYRDGNAPERLIATGKQEVVCLVRREDEWIPSPFPLVLMEALKRCTEEEELLESLDNAIAFVRDRGAILEPAPRQERADLSFAQPNQQQIENGDRR